MGLQETHLRSKDMHELKVQHWQKIYYVNGNQKRAGWFSNNKSNRL